MLKGKTGYGFQYINNNIKFISMSEFFKDFERTTHFYDYQINCDLIKELLGIK